MLSCAQIFIFLLLASFTNTCTSSGLWRARLHAGAKVNAPDTVGATPLHRACSNSCVPVIEALLKAGASVTAVDKGGNTPLHVAVTVACDRASAEAAFVLIRHGANIHAANKDEQTPMSLAGENAAALEAVAAEASGSMET